MWAILKTKMLMHQPKANLHKKVLFGKFTHHLEPEIRKMLVRCMLGKENSTFHSGP